MGGSANTGKRVRSLDSFGLTAVRSQVPVLDSQEPLRNLSQKLLVKGVAGWTRPLLDSCTCLPRSSVCVCACVCVYSLTFWRCACAHLLALGLCPLVLATAETRDERADAQWSWRAGGKGKTAW